MTKTITKGSRAVFIQQDASKTFYANLYVNWTGSVRTSDITNYRGSFQTLKGAEKWAARQLAA